MIEKSQKCKQALAFATQKHEGQTRKLGEPYITHPIAVAEMMVEKGLSEDYIIAALFHDLLEDTDATEKEISDIGGEAVLAAVKLLTKEQNYQMDSYIAKIKENPIARAVKLADLKHNSDLTRLDAADEKAMNRVAKYARAIAVLLEP